MHHKSIFTQHGTCLFDCLMDVIATGDNVYNINVTLAESMPLYRDVPDSRPKGCSAIKYDRYVIT